MDTIVITSIFYILSTVGYLAYLFFQKKRIYKAGFYLLIVGFLFHSLALAQKLLNTEMFISGNFNETMFFAAWAVAAVFMVFQYFFDLKILGIYVAPLLTLVILGVLQLPAGAGHGRGILNSFWLFIHIITVFTGEAAFALAFGIGGLYLIQERAIKAKKHGFFFKRLPSLELLDRAGYTCIVAGFTLLTIGLVSGMIYAQNIWGQMLAYGPKEIWSGITWLLYAVLLHQRVVIGWRGTRASVMAIICFIALLFTFHFLWCQDYFL